MTRITAAVAFVALATLVTPGRAQHAHTLTPAVPAPPAADSALPPMLTAYLRLKDALVTTDTAAAHGAAESLGKALGAADTTAYTAEQRAALRAAAGEVAKIVAANGAAAQRVPFKPLSATMIELAKAVTSHTLYVQHCPMADHNTGGSWLSESKEIANPYFGSAMLKCGRVTETLTRP